MTLGAAGRLALLAAVSIGFVQAAAATTLTGIIRSIYGGTALPGARVAATDNRTGATGEATTDSSGRYEIVGVEPGTYTVTVSLSGFGTLVARDFCVIAGRPAVFSAALGLERGAARDDPTVPARGGRGVQPGAGVPPGPEILPTSRPAPVVGSHGALAPIRRTDAEACAFRRGNNGPSFLKGSSGAGGRPPVRAIAHVYRFPIPDLTIIDK